MPPDIYATSGEVEAGTNDAADASQLPPGDASADAATNTPSEPGTDAGEVFGDDPPTPGCDLTGSWLITERLIASGLGAKQAAIYWLYYEFEQSGEQLRVKKGLVCGTVVQPVDLVSAAVDMRGSWPKLMEQNPHAGRVGSIKPRQNGCTVSMQQMPYVIGASMPYYEDRSRTLPTVEQAAAGSAPGWEDWDLDGKPGVSMYVSGLATGVRYSCTRTSSSWSGEIASAATHFKLSSIWLQDDSVLGVTSEILKATAARDADPSLHFTEFDKLEQGQVSGDDSAICKQIRELAPTLTPEANR